MQFDVLPPLKRHLDPCWSSGTEVHKLEGYDPHDQAGRDPGIPFANEEAAAFITLLNAASLLTAFILPAWHVLPVTAAAQTMSQV